MPEFAGVAKRRMRISRYPEATWTICSKNEISPACPPRDRESEARVIVAKPAIVREMSEFDTGDGQIIVRTATWLPVTYADRC